nr:MAG TPA: hypothetical protein [Caudoviricetes sp.]
MVLVQAQLINITLWREILYLSLFQLINFEFDSKLL